MKLYPNLYILLVAFLLLFVACDDSDKFSSDPNLKLEYSRDMLRFDTIFTTITSPMQRMKVYNRNKNSITFDKIELVNAEQSGFRLNVDGWAGTKFEDVDLLKKDSIYITVDIKANELNGRETLIKDAIRLEWNGNTKLIPLEANGIDVIVWDDKTITSDTHLTSEKGFYIKGVFRVNEGVTLTVDPGATFYFDKKGKLEINGTLVADGEVKNPITFRGHRFDFIERNIPYDNAFDQWRGVFFGSNSFQNVLNNVRIRNSQVGIDFEKSVTTTKKATVTNTVIHNTYSYGLAARNSNIDFVNTQITNSKGVLLNLLGGSYSFLHCTIANYYQWQSRTLASVIIQESDGAMSYPLLKADFVNSIIVGTFKEELTIIVNKANPKYLFTNCVIQAYGESDIPSFVNTVWNISTVFLFKNLNSEGRYFYSFELTDDSSARNKANISNSQNAPLDLRGVSRLVDGEPDIGCYEFTN